MSGQGLDAQEQAGLDAMRKALPFELPSEQEIDFWSLAQVQTTSHGSGAFKKMFTSNSDGYLMLAPNRLVFVTLPVEKS